MGTKMQKLMTVLLLSLSIGLVGGSPAFAQSCVDFISKMTTTAVDLEDMVRQKEMQGPISKAEAEVELKGPHYMECSDTSPKALSGKALSGKAEKK